MARAAAIRVRSAMSIRAPGYFAAWTQSQARITSVLPDRAPP